MPPISKGSDFGKSEDKLPLDSVRRQSTNQTVLTTLGSWRPHSNNIFLSNMLLKDNMIIMYNYFRHCICRKER